MFLKGERVGCFLQHDSGKVRFLGFGIVEEENEVPPDTVHHFNHEWCRIKLDIGIEVWGVECAVFSEETAQRMLQDAYSIEHITGEGLQNLRQVLKRAAEATHRDSTDN